MNVYYGSASEFAMLRRGRYQQTRIGSIGRRKDTYCTHLASNTIRGRHSIKLQDCNTRSNIDIEDLLHRLNHFEVTGVL